MEIAYISDQKYYYCGGDWYTTAVFPLEDLKNSFGKDISKIIVYGRIYHTTAPLDTGLLKIVLPNDIDTHFLGTSKKGGSFKSYIKILPHLIITLRRAIKNSNIIYLKLPFVSSYLVYIFKLKTKNQKIITHLVGDPQLSIKSTLGKKYNFLSELACLLTKNLVKISDLSIFVSNDLKDKYSDNSRKSITINESRLRINQVSSSKAISSSIIKIVFVGRLSPEKNIFSILDAILTLKNDGVKIQLTIIGEGILRKEIEDYIKRFQLSKEVFLTGSIPWGTSLFESISNNHILVLPSETEGFPLVLIEAMSQGLPCIGSNIGGIPEIIKDGENGKLIRRGNSEDIVDSILEITKNSLIYSEYSEKSITTAMENTIDKQFNMLRKEIKLLTQ